MKPRTATTATTLLLAAALVAVLVPRLVPVSRPRAASPSAADSAPGPAHSPGRRSKAGDLSSDDHADAAALTGRLLAYLHAPRDTSQLRTQEEIALFAALARLSAMQHRQVMNALLAEESLDLPDRAGTASRLSLDWLHEHDRPGGSAGCASALATLQPFISRMGTGLDTRVVTPSLEFIAQRYPDLAARWFSDHLSLWTGPNSYPTAEVQRMILLGKMAAQPASALAQVDLLAPRDRSMMYAAIARGAASSGHPDEALAAFEQAARIDPAAGVELHQALLTGLGRGLVDLPAHDALAWLDAGYLSATDQQEILKRLAIPPQPQAAALWIGWLDGKIPAADLQDRVATLATTGATHSPGATVMWITSLPDGPARETAIHSFAANTTDPAEAAKLASALPPDHPAHAALTQVGRVPLPVSLQHQLDDLFSAGPGK